MGMGMFVVCEESTRSKLEQMFEDMGLTVRESRSYPVFEIKAVPGSERNWHSEAFKFDDYEHAVIVMREEDCEPFLEDFDLNPRADLIQYLEENGWEGPDASITISLYEYGYLFKDFGDGDWGVIHYDVRREKSSYGLPNCSKRLAFAVLDSDEIEDWEDEYCEEAEELTGLSHEEWSDLYTPSKLMDMNSIVGMLWEIFYGAYKLTEKEMLSFLREDVNG